MGFLKTKNHSSIMSVFQGNPDRYGPLVGFASAVMDTEGQLTRAEREEIALFTSGLNGCKYCIGDHSAVLKNLGLDPERIKAAAAGSCSKTDKKMRAILVFAKTISKSPNTLRQEDIDTVTNEGWSEQTVEDTIAICALFNLFNRLILATGIEATPEEHALTGKMLARGYAPG